ncbi:small RNA-binding protein 11, chloroplastic [Ricinus communis]|uniref:Cold-inducible RNA-binding protein, putative n=1 Tax=Ricinus communis TaxID=3988 RepID=B9SCX5_RICCO|nr:small RNA-binding protein 11, chloroplastic [Ricinus communis]EEF38570.1 Cold-inducible RNA-binding protein, putative [Ricinus communis]|eukprot:XP_002523844.1 small RNA-binding protein 11, chloroplastic [Ricinus communis]
MVSLRATAKGFLQIISHSKPNTPLFFSTNSASSSRLFVKGISFSSTTESLTEAFSKFGEIVEVNIIKDKAMDRPKGYAYVTFATENEAKKALTEMNGKVIDGRPVFVDNVSSRSIGRLRQP